jgi:transcription antitermination protein NusB
VTSRREARRLALDIVYQADVTGSDPVDVSRSWSDSDRMIPDFTNEIVAGIAEHLPDVDVLLEEHAEDWSVERMAALDRSILRVAVYELLYRSDVPRSVAISEAVASAAELSSEASKSFVNGVLGRIARELPAAG